MWKNNYFKSCTTFIQGCICFPQHGDLTGTVGMTPKVTPTSQKRLSLFSSQNLGDILLPHRRKQTYTKVKKRFLLRCNNCSSTLAAHRGSDKSEGTWECSYYGTSDPCSFIAKLSGTIS